MIEPCVGQAAARFVVVIAIIDLPAVAQAGMPSINLTDIARMRLDAISFFAAGFLASAWGIQRLWNLLQRDFTRLPRLTFKAAAGVVFLWGILFVLVLTMISGARELMTPGAWEKQGVTFKLASQNTADRPPEKSDALSHRREQQLRKLHVALLDYAARHDGRYPPADEIESMDSEHWCLPDRQGGRYLYVPGRSINTPAAIVAYEPLVYDDRQLVLHTDGRIKPMAVHELQIALDSGNAQ
jgi:hypothetical protein